jgi:hypothetical protein
VLTSIFRFLAGLPPKPSLEQRVAGLEYAVIKLCDIVVEHVNRIDQNTKALDSNIKNIAQAVANTIRPFPGQSNN